MCPGMSPSMWAPGEQTCRTGTVFIWSLPCSRALPISPPQHGPGCSWVSQKAGEGAGFLLFTQAAFQAIRKEAPLGGGRALLGEQPLGPHLMQSSCCREQEAV